MAAAGYTGTGAPQVPVDAHVHFHRLALVGPTLDAAAGNFAACTTDGTPLTGILLLAQSARERVFEQIADAAVVDGWRISTPPSEAQTAMAESGGRRIAVVCGRQIRCELGLEVLALGTTASWPDGQPLVATLERVRADGALAVVPWGLGKWTGEAGRVMRQTLQQGSPDTLFAGDNGGRLQGLGLPGLLREAAARGYRILPGTDPFPFGADYRRVGAFGFRAAIDPRSPAPWTALRDWLGREAGRPEPYGRGLNPLRFVFNQGWIQVVKRMQQGSAR